jgi:hypothetical protein
MCGTMQIRLKNKTKKVTQLEFYKIIAAPILMYGSEYWALDRSEMGKIETAHMRFSRRFPGHSTQYDGTKCFKNICFRRRNQRLQKQVA